jgi:hypothetical protein
MRFLLGDEGDKQVKSQKSKVRNIFAQCPMPNAQCPMPNAHRLLLKVSKVKTGNCNKFGMVLLEAGKVMRKP